jgi:hypothetical protein
MTVPASVAGPDRPDATRSAKRMLFNRFSFAHAYPANARTKDRVLVSAPAGEGRMFMHSMLAAPPVKGAG